MRLRDRIAAGAGGLAVVVAVFAVGGAHRLTVVALVGLLAIAAAAQLPARRVGAGRAPLVVFFGLACALTAAQLVPLPYAWVEALHPIGAQLVRDGAALRGEATTWLPLSMDPASTRVELLELIAYLLLAWVACRFAVQDRRRTQLVGFVALLAIVAALTAFVHELLGARALFGLYTPSQGQPVLMAPLLNGNHMATFMVMGTLLSAAMALRGQADGRVRAVWALGALACLAAAMATRSRGGVAALVVGAVVFAVIVGLQRLHAERRGRRRGRDWLRVALPATVVIACTLVLVIAVSGEGVGADLAETDLDEVSDPRSKYAAWASSTELLEASPWVGVGRGGFASAFTRVHPASAFHTFSHVENEYLQAALDWGLVGAGVLLVGLGWLVWTAVGRWRGGLLPAAGLAVMAAVAVASVVDFGIELPGVAAPLIVVVATLSHRSIEEREDRWRRPRRAAMVAAAVAVAGWTALPSSATLAEDHAVGRSVELSAANAGAMARRHPLDYVAEASLARALREQPAATAHLAQALRLHPAHPWLHRASARMALARGEVQAAAEAYRRAVEGTASPESLVRELVRGLAEPAAIAQALPAGHPAHRRIAETLLTDADAGLAAAYLQTVAASRPTDVETHTRLIHAARRAGEFAVAVEAARARVAAAPTARHRTELGELLRARGDVDGARQALASFATQPAAGFDDLDGWLLLCTVMADGEAYDDAKACLLRLGDEPLTTRQRKQRHLALARVWLALGNRGMAELERKQAAAE